MHVCLVDQGGLGWLIIMCGEFLDQPKFILGYWIKTYQGFFNIDLSKNK